MQFPIMKGPTAEALKAALFDKEHMGKELEDGFFVKNRDRQDAVYCITVSNVEISTMRTDGRRHTIHGIAVERGNSKLSHFTAMYNVETRTGILVIRESHN